MTIKIKRTERSFDYSYYIIILCRIGQAFYLPKPLQKERRQIIRQKQNLHHPSYKFFLREGRAKGKA